MARWMPRRLGRSDRPRELTSRIIMEMKFRGEMPGLFKRLVEEFALEPSRVSKYRLGIAATRPDVAATSHAQRAPCGDSMPDFLRAPFADAPPTNPADLAIRLIVAVLLGAGVAGVYRATRGSTGASPTFPITLVLLSVLIAMVTQVIGDNVARAFSLVGALSIVRFRTVVRDTQDTAFVIFAVVIGMAVGARDLIVAGIGIVIVGGAAFLMRPRRRPVRG